MTMFKTKDIVNSNDESPWKKLKHDNSVQLKRNVTHVDMFKGKYSYVTEKEIPIIECGKQNQIKNMSFFSNASCCRFRIDGKMILIGTKSGELMLVPTETNDKALRKFSVHNGNIRKVDFLYKFEKVQQLSVSIGEDGTLQIWDLSEATVIHNFQDSKEPLTYFDLIESHPDIIATSSIDKCLRIYDISQSSPLILKLETAYTIHCVSFPINGSPETILTTQGGRIQLWNTRDLKKRDKDGYRVPKENKLVHHMQITDMNVCQSFDNGEKVVITCGLDGLVHIMSFVDFVFLYKFEYPTNLMSLAMATSCEYLTVVGNDPNDPSIGYVYTRRLVLNEVEQKKTQIEEIKELRVKITHFDKLIRKFKFQAAWNYLLTTSSFNDKVENVEHAIETIDRAYQLERVIRNRSANEVKKILFIISKYIWHPEFNKIINVLLVAVEKCYTFNELKKYGEYQRIYKTLRFRIKCIRISQEMCVNLHEICDESTNNKYR